MSENVYWDLFCENGNIEQYLKYRRDMVMQSKEDIYAGAENSKSAKGTRDSN